MLHKRFFKFYFQTWITGTDVLGQQVLTPESKISVLNVQKSVVPFRTFDAEDPSSRRLAAVTIAQCLRHLQVTTFRRHFMSASSGVNFTNKFMRSFYACRYKKCKVT
jgi:hypothetical protein